MQSKLFFLLFFFFTLTTFSSTEKTNKRKRSTNKTNDLQSQNTQQDGFPNKLNLIPFRENNLLNSPSFTVSFQTKDTNNAIDLLKAHEEESFSSVPSNSLNKLLENSNVFCFIFPYLSFFDLELKFKYTSTSFYYLYEKFLQEEKTFLQSCLANEKIFLENKNYTSVYFDFFEKRFYNKLEKIEYVNVDYFSENLVLLPKSIRQMFSFKFNFGDIQYKYILFKNGHLSILNKILEENFVFTSLEKDFLKYEPWFLHDRLASFQENVRWLDVSCLGGSRCNILLYKKENFKQHIWHNEGGPKIYFCEPFRGNSVVFLKNFSGFLELIGSVAHLCRFQKQKNGLYVHTFADPYELKYNVKKIKSKDFEHYAEEAQFIFF